MRRGSGSAVVASGENQKTRDAWGDGRQVSFRFEGEFDDEGRLRFRSPTVAGACWAIADDTLGLRADALGRRGARLWELITLVAPDRRLRTTQHPFDGRSRA